MKSSINNRLLPFKAIAPIALGSTWNKVYNCSNLNEAIYQLRDYLKLAGGAVDINTINSTTAVLYHSRITGSGKTTYAWTIYLGVDTNES